MWRKTVVATAIVGAGFAATTGSAFAGENDHDQDHSSSSHEGHESKGEHDGDEHRDGDKHRDGGKHHKSEHGDDAKTRSGDQCGSDVKTKDDGDSVQKGLVNVSDTDAIIPTDLCQNNIPLNVLGVQIPIQDLGLNIPVLSPSDDNGGNTSEVS